MTRIQPQKLPRPLLVSEKNSFANFTFINRIPTIIQQVIEENNYPESIVEELNLLKQDIAVGSIRNFKDETAPDHDNWRGYIEPYLGEAWRETPFYFAEAYFYRRILEATQYFAENSKRRLDPFSLQKRLGLKAAIDSIRSVSRLLTNSSEIDTNDDRWLEVLQNFIYLNLWGNRADLSLNPSKAGDTEKWDFNIGNQLNNVIVDNTLNASEKLRRLERSRVDLIADNSGFELFTDLCLIDLLLSSNIAETVCLHLKAHPTFVSDATIEDVNFTIQALSNDECVDVGLLANRLQRYLDAKRLCLRDDFFWNSSLEFWHMPKSLLKDLGTADFIFFKGDANYRRLIGDRHWDFTQPFASIVAYFPTTLVAVRTLKSEVIVGLTQSQIDTLEREDPKWLINGQRGVVQLFDSKLPSVP